MAVLPVDEELQQKASTLSRMTFTMKNEDHTLGNMLRAVLAGRPAVEYVGYSIPHPTSNQMNLRLQMLGDRPAVKQLSEALGDVAGMCDVLLKAWKKAESQLQN